MLKVVKYHGFTAETANNLLPRLDKLPHIVTKVKVTKMLNSENLP